jgi:hypothetical protein
MKIGKEVEGRHIGLKTLFCSAKELMDSPPNVKFAAEEWHVHQIYISDLENELDLSDMNVFLGVLALSYIVTVERTEVPAEYVSEHIDLMLNIDSESFWNLRHTDQVKFSKDLVVFSASKNNMAVTIPDDFNGDVEID